VRKEINSREINYWMLEVSREYMKKMAFAFQIKFKKFRQASWQSEKVSDLIIRELLNE
jgi:hypothetical protein